ncbi:SPRY domain-containing SOCS box protein 3 isoform X2 [Prionailurus viverrinus]|uniref:SPRY domain-containing SOCS box protein 3 isoform X2 n=1 Tax=Prionailurus viverrinus TaxID=61388 RepID=UPI001FF303EA|nr:SPRY domain-containing SOCS box protein 3 isoform X2 [Prionailurus viverrinus]
MCRAARPLLRAASARQHPAAAAGPMRRGGRAAGRGLFTSRSGAESRSRPPGGTRRRRQILSTMARRPRSSTAWHFVLSAARRDADARAVALAGSANWGYDSDGQHSDSDSDPESSALPPPIPSAVPVTGESFCDCDSPSEASFCNSLHAAHRGKDCRCGEEDEHFDWVWDDLNKSSATLLSCDNRKVNFHTEYSCGTAAIRGTKELGEGQHFWEIKMTSPVYGTDMVSSRGAGGRSASRAQARPPPPQLAGLGRPLTPCAGPALPRWWASGHQTWIWTSITTHSAACSAGTRTAGASPIRVRGALRPVGRAGGRGGMAHPSAAPLPRPPSGLLHHKGDKMSFSSRFGQGSIIGVHLDTWHGTLTFFKNRKCIGVAATKLQNKKFYPMVCSTAAKSSMKVIRSCASVTSLQFLCCYRLRQLRPDSGDTLEGLPLPPGLKQVLRHKLGWVLSMSCGRHKPPAPSPKATADPGGPETRRCQRKRCRRT